MFQYFQRFNVYILMQIATIEDKFIFLKEILDIELKTDINEVD